MAAWGDSFSIKEQLCFLFQLALGHSNAQDSRTCTKVFPGLIDKAGG